MENLQISRDIWKNWDKYGKIGKIWKNRKESGQFSKFPVKHWKSKFPVQHWKLTNGPLKKKKKVAFKTACDARGQKNFCDGTTETRMDRQT